MSKIKLRHNPDAPHRVSEDPNQRWAPQTPLNMYADGRDILSSFVGGGNVSVVGEDMQHRYKKLVETVGAPMAQKLVNQVSLFNQRPDVQKLSPEQRVQNFFAQGSNDAEVSQFLKNSASIGQGQTQGFNNSTLFANSVLQNKAFTQPTPPPEPGRRIKLVARK